MRVEIWSDVVCPWCYIGKRRFEAALAAFDHRDEVEVVWKSFELDPGAPAVREGDLTTHLAHKYGTDAAGAQDMIDRMSAQASGEGLEYRLDAARGGNTFDAHRLIHLGAAHGLQGAVKERLLGAYHCDGVPIGDPSALGALAVETGLDPEEVQAVLAGDAFGDAVRADEREGNELGITGVPFFVIGRRYGVSGAQPSDVLLDALERAWAESRAFSVLGTRSNAGTCDDGACDL
ncbi:MAG: protein disulfide isomerase FrnE [Acidimicrobiales bacterium]